MNKKLILILLATVLVISSLSILVSCGQEVSIDHIEIYSMPKTEYSLGESLDITDAKIKVVYKDNTEKLVDITSSMLSGFDSNTLGEQYIKVYYENQSTVFT
ncbi:MAG: bacterial Ig-like domain-containing protein, partial [Clostridia bacterium]|nr:bacterial Ig-like domain-containing protein [Clostridia bacterium]